MAKQIGQYVDTDGALEAGNRATAIMGATAEMIEDQKRQVIARLIGAYRSNKVDYNVLVGGVAELKALDDFQKNCENTQVRGNVAAERMHRDAR